MRWTVIALFAATTAYPQATVRVTGVITDDRGQGIRGEVTAITIAAGVRMKSSLSDEQGRFAVEVGAGVATLSAQADGYAAEEQAIVIVSGRPNPPVRFALSHAGSVSGTVVDTSGAVVPGVRVWLDYRGERKSWRRGEEAGGEETDSSGRFTIPVVAQGKPFVLHAESDAWLLSSSGTLTLRGRDMGGVLLLLSRPGTSVSGRVLDVNGRPVGAAVVRLRAIPNGSEYSDEQRSSIAFTSSTHKAQATSVDGTYRFAGIPSGAVVITADAAQARGFGEGRTSAERETRIDLTIR